MLVKPAMLRWARLAFEESVPSSILIPLLPFAANVMLTKVGLDKRDIAIGSRREFWRTTFLISGVELFSHRTPKSLELEIVELESVLPASVYVTPPQLPFPPNFIVQLSINENTSSLVAWNLMVLQSPRAGEVAEPSPFVSPGFP